MVKLPRALLSDSTAKRFPDVLVTERLLGPSVKATVPFGFTLKLTVPLPCFENDSGLGLVVTVTIHGVGVGLGLTPGEADGEADGLALGLGLVTGDATGLAPGLGLAPGDADGLAPGDGDAEGLPSPFGVGVGVGFGVLLAPSVDPLSIGLRFVLALTFGMSSR
jgi:hypothetical protein